MVRAFALTALVAAVASGLQAGNDVEAPDMVRRAGGLGDNSFLTEAPGAESTALGGTDDLLGTAPDPAATGLTTGGSGSRKYNNNYGYGSGGSYDSGSGYGSSSGYGSGYGSGSGGYGYGKGHGRHHGSKSGGNRRYGAQETGLDSPLETGLTGAGGLDDPLAGTGVPLDGVPTATGLGGVNSPLETGLPGAAGLDPDETGNLAGVASVTGAGPLSSETPVLISEGSRPVGRVTAVLGLGAVALAFGLS